MFSENKPAQNINQLLEYLKSNDADSFLYRGQIQDYPACIPSIYRSAISEQASTKDPIVSIANDVFHKSITHQRVARFEFLLGQ